MTFLDNTGLAYFWSKLKALFATKSELEVVRQSASKAYHYKGSVATVADLPANAEQGDVYNVGTTLDGDNYAWTGTAWDKLGASVDLSPYALDADVVKLSGNQTIDGQKTFTNYVKFNVGSGSNWIASSGTSQSLALMGGGSSVSDGGYLVVYGKTHADAGQFKFVATDGTNTKTLIGKPDGTLTWNSKAIAIDEDVVHKTGDETINGTKTFAGWVWANSFRATSYYALHRDVNDDRLIMYGGKSTTEGAFLVLYGRDHTYTGMFRLSAVSSTSTKHLDGKADGTLTWDNKDIAIDENVVHKTGNETVSGKKTFSSTVFVSGTGALGFRVDNTTAPRSVDMRAQDNGNAGIWDGTNNRWMIHAISGGVTDVPDGLTTVAPAASDSSTRVPTTAWVGSNAVMLSGDQNIGGTKTFTSGIHGNTSELRVQNDKTGNDGFSSIYGGAGYSTGGYLSVYGISHASYPGQFRVIATTGSVTKTLIGKPDGSLTWDSKSFVFTSTDQDIAGVKRFTGGLTVKRTSTSSNADILFAENDNSITALMRLVTETDQTPRLQIAIKGTSGQYSYSGPQLWLSRNGNVVLRTTNASGGSVKDLILNNGGSATWGGQTIQTSSDERLKTSFSYVPNNILDIWGKVDWEQFKFKEACEEKGTAQARWHTGLVAQHVKEVFDEEAQDVLRYGILCHDEWEDEHTQDEDGKEILVRAAGDMWTIRYEEALCMEAAYQRRRADRAEARITVLERRLDEMEAAIASLISPMA